MGVYINMEMPKSCDDCRLNNGISCYAVPEYTEDGVVGRTEDRPGWCPLVPVPPHGRLRRRIVYRGEVYNALESARVNALDGILSDPYKEGFHDGIKKAIQILANEVDDAPTIIPAEEGN